MVAYFVPLCSLGTIHDSMPEETSKSGGPDIYGRQDSLTTDQDRDMTGHSEPTAFCRRRFCCLPDAAAHAWDWRGR